MNNLASKAATLVRPDTSTRPAQKHAHLTFVKSQIAADVRMIEPHARLARVASGSAITPVMMVSALMPTATLASQLDPSYASSAKTITSFMLARVRTLSVRSLAPSSTIRHSSARTRYVKCRTATSAPLVDCLDAMSVPKGSSTRVAQTHASLTPAVRSIIVTIAWLTWQCATRATLVIN